MARLNYATGGQLLRGNYLLEMGACTPNPKKATKGAERGTMSQTLRESSFRKRA